jgi:hypothetical protein
MGFYLGCGWLTGDETLVTYQDPSETGCSNTYPFGVTDIVWHVYACVATTIDVRPVVYEDIGAPDCPLPGAVLCTGPVYQVELPDRGSWIITLSLDNACCVDGPYFAGVVLPTYYGPNVIDIIMDDSITVPAVPCRNYNDWGFGWRDLVVDEELLFNTMLWSEGRNSIQSQCGTPPYPACRNVTVDADSNCVAEVGPEQVDDGSSDPDCDSITLTLNPPGPYELGAHPVWLVVEDTCGAIDSCDATITVEDNTPPVVQCPADITQGTDPGQCGAIVTFSASVTDNCTGATISCMPPSGSFYPVGGTLNTCIGTDAAGNKDTCYFSVTVNDTEAPVAQCPADIIQRYDPGQSGAVVTFNATVTDNCPGATIVCAPSSGTFFPEGVTVVTCIATNAAANKDTCTFSVEIGCICPYQCDYDATDFLDALDLGTLIDVLFQGVPETYDPGCPTGRGDFDCNGYPDALDLGGLIDHLFQGMPGPCDPCEP